jgi:ubiquinone/menaquinone biosynthesis C-methylase UbiE
MVATLTEESPRAISGLDVMTGMTDVLPQLNKSLRRSYDKQASRYDTQRSISVNGRFFFDVAYRAIDQMLGQTNERTVHLDLPVGTGRLLLFLLERGRRHRMLGIDLSTGMLQTCQEQQQERTGNIRLAMGDAFSLPLPDDSVDIITSLRFFHLLPKRYWPVALAEMRRVIRPGGFVIAELRNQFRGLVVGMAVEGRDRWFRGGRHRSYLWPQQVRNLFGEWGPVEMRGAGLDGLSRLWSKAPRPARRLHEVTRYWPLRYFAKELLVKAYKPVR